VSGLRILRRLRDLTDVNASSPSDGDALVYDTGTSKWVPGAVAGGAAVPFVGDDPPPSPDDGDLWWDTDDNTGSVESSSMLIEAWSYPNESASAGGTSYQWASLSWDGDHNYLFPVNVLGYVVSITNAGNYVAKPHFRVTGSGSLPEIPPDLATLIEAVAARAKQGWDVGFSALNILCITGTDAGKKDVRGLDTSVPNPLTDYVNPPGSGTLPQQAVMAFPNVQSGNLGTTMDAGGHIFVANTCIYFVSFAPTIDFFYP